MGEEMSEEVAMVALTLLNHRGISFFGLFDLIDFMDPDLIGEYVDLTDPLVVADYIEDLYIDGELG